MKIRRFIKKRQRRDRQRLEDAMASKHLNAEDRAVIRRFKLDLHLPWRMLPASILDKIRDTGDVR